MKRIVAFLLVLAGLLPLSAPYAQPPRPVPYWASISSGRAMMRTGPGQAYPGIWLYVRPDLPIQVLEIYHDWRKVRDPEGATGWMLVRLLSDQRTAIIRRGAGTQPLHEAPDAASPVRYHAEAGVVGRISRCAAGWCLFDVHGRGGYIRAEVIWGIDRNETVR